MAVQKRRQSKARSASRRAQWRASVKTPTVNSCPRCHAAKAPHRVCLECGYYNDKQVVEVEETE